MPITFQRNDGQANAQYKFLIRGGLDALFSSSGVDFVLPALHNTSDTLKLIFVSPDPKTVISGIELLQAQTNYFPGADPSRFVTHVPNYGDLRYEHIYPGVTLDFYGNGDGLEHDFTIAPHADASAIAFRFSGSASVELSSSGDLMVHTTSGVLRLKKPFAYQTAGGRRRVVSAEFQQRADGSIGFRVGAYDPARPLTIDPVFVFSTYLDGSMSDHSTGVVTDAAGNIYLTGFTSSIDFPTQNAEQPSCAVSGLGACGDVFVSKFDPTGKNLMFSTYLGGASGGESSAIVLDPSGNVIIGGIAGSNDFPHAGSVSSVSCQTNTPCYFLASIKPDGSALNYAGLVGGSEGGFVANNGCLAVDALGNAYFAGTTDDPNFQITPNTLSTTVPGYPYNVLFVLKVDTTGKLVYSTVVPGNATHDPADVYVDYFRPGGIAVDSSGQVTVAGTAGLGLPTTAGVVGAAFPNLPNGENAGFVLQLNATASAIHYATYVPGTDGVGGMAIDPAGNIYVAGGTNEPNLPVTSNAYETTPVQNSSGQIVSGYIAELSPRGTAVLAATYLQGTSPSLSGATNLYAVALDSNRNVFVGGVTGGNGFPMLDPFASEYETAGTDSDMVLAEMSSDLSKLEFGSFLNPQDPVNGASVFSALTVDAGNHFIVTGATGIADFPTTTGAFEIQPPPPPNPNVGQSHIFLSKMDMSIPAPSACMNAWSVSFSGVAALSSSQKSLTLTNCGNAAMQIESLTSNVPTITPSQSCGSIPPGGTCPIVFTFSPVDGTLSIGTVTLKDNAAIPTIQFGVSGQGIAPDLEVSANPFDLGHLLQGTTGPEMTLTLYNRGNGAITISSIATTGPGFSIGTNPCTSSLIAAGRICPIGLIFSPPSAGAFTGSVVIHSSDPVHPVLTVALTGIGDSAYAVPTVSEVSGTPNLVPLPTLQINNGAVTVTLTGSNFYPQSVVQFNGSSQQASFVSNSQLNVTIAASSLSKIGEFPLTVFNPTPGGGTSAPFVLTTFQKLPLTPNFIVAPPGSSLIYAAMPSSDATYPNTVLPIDPTTGTPGTPIAVGKNPVLLAPSSDGAYLYVANDGDGTVQRINLTSNAVERTFPYASSNICTPCTASDLKSIPGLPQEVILSQGRQVALYNDSGLVNYVPNSNVSNGQFNSIAFAGNPLALYAEPFTSVQNPFFYTVAITSSGLQYTQVSGSNFGTPNGTGSEVVSDGKLLYTNSGEVWDPVTQKMVGSFAAPNSYYPGTSNMLLDTGAAEIFMTGDGSFITPGPGGYTYSSLDVRSFDPKSLAADNILTFPQINAVAPYSLTRWGSNGFAFLIAPPIPGAAGVYVFRSGALAGTTNPVPALMSLSPANAIAGASDLSLFVNGTGFILGSAVTWNGATRATTYISPTQLAATIPASDLATATTAQVKVANPAPGGGASGAVSFVIQPPGPFATLSASSLNFGTTYIGASSSAQLVTLTNSGNAPLSIGSITASGNFSQSNTCGSSLAAGVSCQISITFQPASAAALAGAVTITDNAPTSPQTVSLSGTGAAPALSIGATSGNSTSATVTSGATATYNLQIGATPGFNGTVALSCSGAPQYAACSVSPTSLTISAGAAVPIRVTVTTNGSASAFVARVSTVSLAGFGIGALLLLPFSVRIRKRIRQGALVLFAIFCICVSISACGGGGGSQGTHGVTQTPPGTYSLTLTASTSGNTATQVLTLTVQ